MISRLISCLLVYSSFSYLLAGPMEPIEDDPTLPRVLLIGDSISIGYTLDVRERLTGVANVHRPSQNCGPTIRGLDHLDRWLGAGRWDVIHFNFGLHDLKWIHPDSPKRHGGKLVPVGEGFQMVRLPEYEANLEMLVERLKQTGARLIWCSTTPVPVGAKGRVPGHSARYNAVAAGVMKRHGVAINDLYQTAHAQLEAIQKPADVHFTKEGSAVLGEQVASVIGASLKGLRQWPAPADLPEQVALPDPLTFFAGGRVETPVQWPHRRKEILRMLEKYVYGRMPGRPLRTGFDVESQVTDYLDGKATRKWVRIDFGPAGASPIHLLLVVPNGASGSSPVILGLNFNGTHTVVPDTDIPLTTHWVRALKKGGPNEATEEGRGTSASRWPIAEAIERGYAVATFYQGDIDPDNKDLTNGIQSHYYRKGQTQPDPEEWGTIAAWAWGLHRAVDYLVTDPDIDPNKVVVMGHSRNGKTALVAGAFDPRIALTISNQSGCGGAAISRRRKGETVAVINRNFPHWFCGNFGGFDDRENFLPLDQHFLMAAIAPRPVLVCSAKDDGWADPLGEFEALQGAEPVYDLLGVDGLGVEEQPELNRLVGQRLGYHIRPGKHGVGSADWKVFMDFADEQWSSKP